MTPEELANILVKLFQPDTQAVKQATEVLKPYFKQVEALNNLLMLVRDHQDQQIRQVSCLYLRKIIVKLWPNLNADQQTFTKNLLLQRFKEEPITLVKKNIADVIGSLGSLLIPNKEWPDLFVFIMQSTQSEQLADKELAMILLSVIIEYFTHEDVKTYYSQLNPIIESYLQSGVRSLMTLSIETVNKLAQTPKAIQTLKQYNQLIPLVLNAMDEDNEDLIHKVFETFNEFVEIKKVLKPHLPQITKKAIDIAENQDFGVNLREVTILFLELIAEKYARIMFKNHGIEFIDAVIRSGMNILSEDPSKFDENEASPPDAALSMLYAFACNLPNEKVFPVFQKYLHQFGTSTDKFQRAAATAVLGQLADPEACLDMVKENLDPLTNFLVDRMADNDFEVREAAGETVGRFSEHVVPDFLDKHKQIMPVLMRVVKDMAQSKHEMTIQKTIFAINEFVQNLDYDIKLYLDDVVNTMIVFTNGDLFSREVRYWALFALSSTIGISQKKIIPYQARLLEVFSGIVNENKGENQNVKGQALMCIGKLASSCGRDHFNKAALEQFTQFALSCLSQNKTNQLEIRETAITYFSDLSVLMKDEIAPIFDTVINEILATCKKEENFKKTYNKKEEGAGGFSLDSDSEDEVIGLDIDVGDLDEKTAAVNALGLICCHSPKLAQAKQKEILETLDGLQNYFHENVKFHVCLAYLQIGVGLMRLEGKMNDDDKFEWVKGAPSGSPLPASVSGYLNQIVFPYFIRVLETEENKEVIERVLENLREIAEDFGPSAFEQTLPKICEQIVLLLQKKAFCQTHLGADEDEGDLEDVEENPEEAGYDDEEDDEDDGIDHDEVIFGNTSDLIIALARAYGNEFLPAFEAIYPHLQPYTTEKHPKSDRNMAMGCLSEVFAAAPGSIPALFDSFWALVNNLGGTTDCKLNRNVAYSIGVLAEHAQMLFQPRLQEALAFLSKLHANSAEAAAQDNIVAASCRIIEFQLMPLPAEQRPAEYQTMLDTMFDKIPFSGDDTENETILKFAFKLYQQDNATCLKYMEKIAQTCLKCIVDDKCADQLLPKFKREVGQFLKTVVVQHAQAYLQQMEGQMNEFEKKELAKYMA